MSAAFVAGILLRDLSWAILVYFVMLNSFYALLLASAALELRRLGHHRRGAERWRLLGSVATPRISIVAPAFNEEATVRTSVLALLAIVYPNLEVVLVNDGSRDATIDVLTREFELLPVQAAVNAPIATRLVRRVFRSRRHGNLIVVDKENGGRSDAVNAGLNLASGSLICVVDADTIIEGDALQRLVQPFIEHEDTIGTGGTIRVANGSDVQHGRIVQARAPRKVLPGIQAVEYLRAFLMGRLGWNRLGGNLIISGAFGLFRRDALMEAGGYSTQTIGEDMELVVRLRRRSYENGVPHRVVFVADAVAWTQVPDSNRVLGSQRDRWHRGLSEVLWRHRVILFNARYRAMGIVSFPYFAFFELLAPVVELVGIVALIVGLSFGMVDVQFAVLFFLLAYGYGTVLTLAALLLEELGLRRYRTLEDRLLLILWAFLENLGYRQRTVVWRVKGLVRFLRGEKGWGVMERSKFEAS